MPIEVAFEDLEEGKFYKLKTHFTLSIQQQGNGTLQEDIDKIANNYYELDSPFDYSDGGSFILPAGETVMVPYVDGLNQRHGPRDYIFISEMALPQGEQTIFLEKPNDNDPGYSNNDPIQTNNVINLTGSSGGKRKRRMSKKRKTRKQKRKSRKSKSRKH